MTRRIVCSQEAAKPRVVEDFLFCIYCLGFVSLREMWRHIRNHCHATLTNSTEAENTTSTIAQARMLLDGATSLPRCSSLDTTERVRRVIVNNMRERGDQRIADTVRKDALILRFEAMLLDRRGAAE